MTETYLTLTDWQARMAPHWERASAELTDSERTVALFELRELFAECAADCGDAQRDGFAALAAVASQLRQSAEYMTERAKRELSRSLLDAGYRLAHAAEQRRAADQPADVAATATATATATPCKLTQDDPLWPHQAATAYSYRDHVIYRSPAYGDWYAYPISEGARAESRELLRTRREAVAYVDALIRSDRD